MMTFSDINILGNIVNTTFGKSSIVKNNTISIKAGLSGEVLTLTYTTICNLPTDRVSVDMLKDEQKVAAKLLNEYVAKMKKEFRAQSKHALKMKKLHESDDIELISMSAYNPKRTAYYRMRVSYEIS